MQINNMFTNVKDNTFYNASFMQVIEDNLNEIKKRTDNTVESVDSHLNYKYEGDFFGLLEEKNIEKDYHYACMRVNDLSSSIDYKGDKNYIVIPNLAYIDALKKTINPRLR